MSEEKVNSEPNLPKEDHNTHGENNTNINPPEGKNDI